MDALLITIISYCFIFLLFWKKYKINIVIVAHGIFVGILIAVCCVTNNFLEVYEVNSLTELDKHEFSYMQTVTEKFIAPILVLWTYQWWLVGKERDKQFHRL